MVGEITLWSDSFFQLRDVCRSLAFDPLNKKPANEKSILFSQEMASSSSHSINNVPLVTLLEWYKIRDTFFGENCVSQNIPLALEMASSCHHVDARWLAAVCEGKNVKTFEDAKRVFLGLGQNDARALCFAWMLGACNGDDRLLMVRRSSLLGCAFAQSLLARFAHKEERLDLAQSAAAQGERDGFFWLAVCFREVETMDFAKATENFLRASELGHTVAMIELGYMLEESDPQRWRWWGRAAASGKSESFLSAFARQVKLFNSGSGSAAVMFAIGQALRDHVNEEERTIFSNA
jgi:hypothetical protein